LFRFGLIVEEYFLANERLYARATEGTTEIPAFIAVQSAVKLLAKPGARDWWEQHSALFSPRFRQAVSETLASTEEGRADNEHS
jgi:aspartate aminotransferase-like enzyme